jgi:hypothetical protein
MTPIFLPLKSFAVFIDPFAANVPFEQGRLVAASIPNARFIPLESSNHVLLSHESAFAQFIDCMNEFLADET